MRGEPSPSGRAAPGKVVLANVVCNTSFTNFVGQQGEDGDGRADVAELQQLFKVEELDGHREVERRACSGGVQGLPGPAGQGGSLADPAGEPIRNMADACRRTIKAVYKDFRTSLGPVTAWVPLVCGQALCLLVVDYDELALVRSAVPLQEDPGALVAQQPQLRAAVGGLQLAPARPVLRQEEIVTISVLEAKSCGAETVPKLVTSPQTTLPVDTPPLVA